MLTPLRLRNQWDRTVAAFLCLGVLVVHFESPRLPESGGAAQGGAGLKIHEGGYRLGWSIPQVSVFSGGSK